MSFKVLVLFVIIAAVQAGYLTPALRYAAPAISYAPAPAVSYAAYSAPLIRTAPLIAPAVHAPLLRTGYVGHSFGYAAAPASINFARAAPLGFARYGAGW